MENARIEGMIRTANREREVMENLLLESMVNHNFKPSARTMEDCDYYANKIAEKTNFIQTLERMLDQNLKTVDVTPETEKTRISQYLQA